MGLRIQTFHCYGTSLILPSILTKPKLPMRTITNFPVPSILTCADFPWLFTLWLLTIRCFCPIQRDKLLLGLYGDVSNPFWVPNRSVLRIDVLTTPFLLFYTQRSSNHCGWNAITLSWLHALFSIIFFISISIYSYSALLMNFSIQIHHSLPTCTAVNHLPLPWSLHNWEAAHSLFDLAQYMHVICLLIGHHRLPVTDGLSISGSDQAWDVIT